MSQQNLEGLKTFIAGADITRYRLVNLNAGSGSVVVHSTLGSGAIGVAQETVTSGNPVSVAMLTPGKTFKIEAEGLSATAGNVSGLPTYNGRFTCGFSLNSGVTPFIMSLESATAAGGVVEALIKLRSTNNW
jgi:hypothetical protein